MLDFITNDNNTRDTEVKIMIKNNRAGRKSRSSSIIQKYGSPNNRGKSSNQHYNKSGGINSKSVSLLTLYNNQDKINKKLLIKNKNKSCIMDSEQIDKFVYLDNNESAKFKRAMSFKSMLSYEDAIKERKSGKEC